MFKKNSIVVIILFFVAVTVLSYWAYSVFSERYAEDGIELEKEKKVIDDSAEDEDDIGWDDDLLDEADEEDSDEDLDEIVDEFLEISVEDCDKECTTYIDTEDVTYCKQVCGLIETKKSESEGECEKLSGLEKDYCYKNKALSSHNASECEKIIDKNVAKTCKNRIWEDILENSPAIPM